MITRRTCLAAFFAVPFTVALAAAADKMTFEIYADAKDEYRWRLLDGDGKNVANSGQGYKNKADCTKMVGNLKNDPSVYAFETYEDNKKEQRFRIKAKNGNVVGASTGSYKTKAEVDKVIAAITSGAKDAVVKEAVKDTKK